LVPIDANCSVLSLDSYKSRKAAQPKRPLQYRPTEIKKARQARDVKNKRLSQIKSQSFNSSGLSGLWNQLLTKVQGDVSIAERLINNLKMKHPGRSDRWYLEKAIFDLERDKGRY
jgi:hypothetical protein